MQKFEALVVGAGPAGLSTALHLCALDPRYAGQILVIEKQRSPRNKICGGAVTSPGLKALRVLGVPLDIPGQRIRFVRFERQGESLDLPDSTEPMVFTRELFDGHLAQVAASRGIEIREGEAFISARREEPCVRVSTDRGEYLCRALVGCDGSRSRVASGFPRVKTMAALRTEIPLDEPDASRFVEFERASLCFDLRPLSEGWYGYLWKFPTWNAGGRVLNCGLFYNRRQPNASTIHPRDRLIDYLRAQGLPAHRDIQAFPIRPFTRRSSFSAPGILLVGDAIGVDPLLGEGISEAIVGGKIAAAQIHESLQRGDTLFAGYRDRVMRSPVGTSLRTTRLLARLFYSRMNPFWSRMIFESAALRAYVHQRFPGYPNFCHDKRELILASLTFAISHWSGGRRGLAGCTGRTST